MRRLPLVAIWSVLGLRLALYIFMHHVASTASMCLLSFVGRPAVAFLGLPAHSARQFVRRALFLTPS
jgi:hypothetical protein